MFCCWVLNLHFHVPFPVSNLQLDLPGVCLAEMRYVYDMFYILYGIKHGETWCFFENTHRL